ncbi:MAG: hypothetical protein IJ110_01550 [Lachnospiraceae bacterium]|nr:hypothetical protein [Lachnospiraceae bacterium]
MARSIIQDKTEQRCILCTLLNNDIRRKSGIEEHHIFGGLNRKLSEHYGLKVYLCPQHHRIGKDAVHQNVMNAMILKMIGQRAFEELYGHDRFMAEFGRNWLPEEEWIRK